MVAFFVYDLDRYSGAAKQALLLAQNMSRKILVFNLNFGRYRKWRIGKNIEIIDLPESNFLQSLIILLTTLRNRIRIYHCHGFFLSALLVGVVLKTRIILKTTLLGDDDLDTLITTSFGSFKKYLMRQIQINVVLSNKLQEINSKHLEKPRIIKIPNGTVIPNESQTESKTNAFCYVGLVCRRKRPLESIMHFHRNYSRIPGSVLHMVGPYESPEHNKDFDRLYVKECFRYVEQNSLSNKVIFTGQLSREETCSIYNKSKALLFFPLKEGMPNVVIEAMAHNCVPVVSEADGVMAEMFQNGKEGIITEPGNSVSISTIDEISQSKAAYRKAAQSFNIEKTAGIYEYLYDDLTN